MDTKKITSVLLSLVFIPGIILAQQTRTKHKGDSTENKSVFMSGSKVIPISQMDQSKIYHWANGQRSTPSGCQAGDPSAIYARVLGDSAVVVRKYVKKH
jgi:hypothetical protein